MKSETSIAIDAPAAVVWRVFTDVERWPEWTASVTRIVPLGDPAIEVGNRFQITQPRLPKLTWEVTAVDPGRGWSWTQRSPGGTTTATHEVIAQGPAHTLVRQGIDQRGPVGTLVGALMRRTTRRYLQLEADGLKARSEAQHRRDGAPA